MPVKKFSIHILSSKVKPSVGGGAVLRHPETKKRIAKNSSKGFKLVFLSFTTKRKEKIMISKVLTLIAVLVSSTCLAHEASNLTDNETMSKIEANKNVCVYGYSENRLYLNPNRIFPTEQGIYLNLNDVDYVLLPTLNSDSSGCYLPCVQILNKCPGCGFDYFISCTRPECPLMQAKKEREREKERAKEERRKEREKERKKKK
jgi:hypothetical protein